MRKPVSIKKFYFKEISNQQVVDEINIKYPIKLTYNADLVDRVHAKYPLIDKAQVGMIVKAIFQSLRELLILGKVLNFTNLFYKTKLLFFTYTRDGHTLPSLKVHIKTPSPLRKL